MRLKPPHPDTFTDDQRRVHDAIASGPRGGVNGPLAIWLHRPDLADRAQALGAWCRYGTLLPPVLSELAIIVTAQVWRASYEWSVHAPIAEKAGLDPAIISAIKDGRRPDFADEKQALVHDFARELHEQRKVCDATYARAVSVLGEPAVVDLVGLLGYYGLVSMTLNVFRDPPE